jgi:AbrB family looped-hinge helix DNA binding protein
MGTLRSKVTAQGQIWVPMEIRRKLEIGPGSVLEWQVQGDQVVVRKVDPYTFEHIHRALFPTPPEPRTLDEMKEGIRRHLRAKHARR